MSPGPARYDVVVIGGGIVGVATAHALCERLRGSLAVLEAEDHLAAHQSGHNSGVIHSGLYYKPGSLKAKNCVEGRDLMYRLVEEHGVPFERCGKVVVATEAHELPALDELERRGLVRNLVYPVPDPAFPFLGVHFTRTIHGGVEAGPNAVLAWKREGYRHRDISLRDLAGMAAYGGFWRMVGRFWKTGMGEMYRSLSKSAFVTALRRLVPDLRADDLERGGSGVRAQAVEPSGLLVDDFRIVEAEGMVHVLNAPSPGATSSLSIGRTIADIAARRFGLRAAG